jgi:hypothetical protein
MFGFWNDHCNRIRFTPKNLLKTFVLKKGWQLQWMHDKGFLRCMPQSLGDELVKQCRDERCLDVLAKNGWVKTAPKEEAKE